MLKCINGLTRLPLLLIKKALFNLLFNAIFNSAIRTLSNKKVTLNHLPQNVLPIAESFNFAREWLLIIILPLLLDLLNLNPIKNKNKFYRTFIVLLNINIIAKLLGKSKSAVKRHNAFCK
jgi:hypothetical protein